MFRRAGALVASLCLILIGSISSSYAYSRDVVLVNLTGLDITRFEVSVPGLQTWVATRGINDLEPGHQANIHFTNTGPCALQLRVNFSNGYHASWRQTHDFCAVNKIYIRWVNGHYVADFFY